MMHVKLIVEKKGGLEYVLLTYNDWIAWPPFHTSAQRAIYKNRLHFQPGSFTRILILYYHPFRRLPAAAALIRLNVYLRGILEIKVTCR